MSDLKKYVDKSLRRIRSNQLKHHIKSLHEEINIIIHHPEIFQQKPIDTKLTTHQQEIITARVKILEEVERRNDVSNSINIAVEETVKLANRGQLPSHLQQYVSIANLSSQKVVNCKALLSRSTIFRWAKLLKSGPDALAPKNERKNSLPTWVEPLFEVLSRQEEPSLHAAICELETKGIRCYRPQAREIIRRLSNAIRANHQR